MDIGRESPLLSDKDPEQRMVILHGNGPCSVTAAAGSGKTGTVVTRYAYLATELGIDPARILCITFTKKAAGEMNERAAKLLGHSKASVHTFHALCRRILAADWPGFSSWSLDGAAADDESEEPSGPRMTYRMIVKEAVGWKFMKWAAADIEELLAFIELCKSDGARPNTPEAQAIARKRYQSKPIPGRDPSKSMVAYELAEDLRQKAFLMTFSDWLVETKELLEKNEEVRLRWAAKFDHIMVDEHQDSSRVQVSIAESLAKDHRNLMVIGDMVQSVYGWRGAMPDVFDEFIKTWNPRILRLDRNYRSARKIVALGNIVRASTNESEATRLTARGQRDLPGAVRCRGFHTQEDEARGIAASIKELHAEGCRYSDVFILYRTNALSRSHEEALAAAGIPFVVIGGSSFYTRKEVRALCSYLRVATPGRARVDDLRRSLREPNRFFSRLFLDAVEDAVKNAPAGSTWETITATAARKVKFTGSQEAALGSWNMLVADLRRTVTAGAEASKVPEPWNRDTVAIAAARPAELLRRVVTATNFLSWLEKDEGRDSIENDRRANVAELIRAAESFGSTVDLINHVESQLKIRQKSRKEDGQDRVTLMTMHGVKGLEKKHVFVSMVNDKVIPHALSEDHAEEMRLWYVAATRARDELNISYITSATSVGGKERSLAPSPFIPPRLLRGEEDLS